MDQPLAPSSRVRLCLDLGGSGASLRPLLSHAAYPRPLLWLHCCGLGNATMSLRSSRPLSLLLPQTAQRPCLAFKSLLAVLTFIKKSNRQENTSYCSKVTRAQSR